MRPARLCSSASPNCRNIIRRGASSALLSEHAPAIASLFPPSAALIEFGSGSSRKARILLARRGMRRSLCADRHFWRLLAAGRGAAAPRFSASCDPSGGGGFHRADRAAAEIAGMPRAGFFPGSTIGNFEPHEAAAFLRRAGGILGAGRGARRRRRSGQGRQTFSIAPTTTPRALPRNSISICWPTSIASSAPISTSTLSSITPSTMPSAAVSKCIWPATNARRSEFAKPRSNSAPARPSTPRTATNIRSNSFQALAQGSGWSAMEVVDRRTVQRARATDDGRLSLFSQRRAGSRRPQP